MQSSEFDEERRSRIAERFRSSTSSSCTHESSQTQGGKSSSKFRPNSSSFKHENGSLCRPVRWQPIASGRGHYMHPNLTSSISTSSHSLHFPMVVPRSGLSLLAKSNTPLFVHCFRFAMLHSIRLILCFYAHFTSASVILVLNVFLSCFPVGVSFSHFIITSRAFNAMPPVLMPVDLSQLDFRA